MMLMPVFSRDVGHVEGSFMADAFHSVFVIAMALAYAA